MRGGRREDRQRIGQLDETRVVPRGPLSFFLLGSTVTAEIQGVIDACVKLTGMPDLTLSFMVRSRATAHLLGMEKEVFLERMRMSRHKQ